VAEQNLDFNIIAHTQGMEQIANLINRVGALEAETKKLASANKTLSTSTDAVISNGKRYNNALDAQSKALRNTRMGTQQLGMQINDFATSVSTGASPVQAFNQQIGQVGFAMSMMEGRLGAVGRFLAGPWSILVIGAAMAVGFLVEKFMAADEAAQDVKFATSFMSDAQSILGNVMDITTGKITTQNAALLDLAKAQIIVAKLQAETRAAEAKGAVADIAKREFQFSGGMGGGFSVGRRGLDARDVISQEVLSGKMTGKVALERLENLKTAGKLTTQQYIEATSAVANLGMELANIKGYEEARKLLEGTGGRDLLKPDKKGAAAAAAAAKRLAAENKRIAKAAEAAREKELKSIESFMDKIGKVGMKEIPAYQREIAQLEKDFMELSKAGQIATIEPFRVAVESIEMSEYSKMLKADVKEAEGMIKDILSNFDEVPVSKEMDAILTRADEMEKSFEAIGTAVSNSFKGILTGAMSFKNAMKGIISAVIDELFRLFVVQQIVGIVSGALGGLKPGGASGGAFGSSTGNFLPGIPANAYGGSVMGNRPTLVGERGPELFIPGGNGTIIPNSNMRGGGGGSPISINVDARGSNDPAAVRAQVQQGILEAAPAIIAAAESRTISNLRRPRLGGAMQ
jgi:hypothetical protein